jgi:hypothetical protein
LSVREIGDTGKVVEANKEIRHQDRHSLVIEEAKERFVET